MEEPLGKTGKKFSDLSAGEITADLIQQFEASLLLNEQFKKRIFTNMSIKWLKDNINVDRDSPAVIRMINEFKSGSSFNSQMMRTKAVNLVRSEVYKQNVNLKLPGVISVTSPADFLTSVYNTSGGRKSRAAAIEYILKEGEASETISIAADELEAFKGKFLPIDTVKIQVNGLVKVEL